MPWNNGKRCMSFYILIEYNTIQYNGIQTIQNDAMKAMHSTFGNYYQFFFLIIEIPINSEKLKLG